jgi:hypothetical protein
MVNVQVVAVGFGQFPPPHETNVSPLAGVSVSVTADPTAYPAEQTPVCVPPAVLLQLIAAGFDLSSTFPAPVTVTDTVAPPDVKPTSTVCAAVIAKRQLI